MKQLLKLITLVTLGVFFIACNDSSSEGFTKSGKAGMLNITYSSAKPLVVGDNIITVKVTNAKKAVTDATVKMKIFMPEMPGMPYMEEVKLMKPTGTSYNANVNFSMGGTWQVKIFIEKDGKKYQYSSSIIL